MRVDDEEIGAAAVLPVSRNINYITLKGELVCKRMVGIC